MHLSTENVIQQLDCHRLLTWPDFTASSTLEDSSNVSSQNRCCLRCDGIETNSAVVPAVDFVRDE
jgi:hypothetical protein